MAFNQNQILGVIFAVVGLVIVFAMLPTVSDAIGAVNWSGFGYGTNFAGADLGWMPQVLAILLVLALVLVPTLVYLQRRS